MSNISLLHFCDVNFPKTNNTIIDYCKKYNIKYIGHSSILDVDLNNYYSLFFAKIYASMLELESEWLVVVSPHTSIKDYNIDINSFFKNGYDISLFADRRSSFFDSFFIIKKTPLVLKSLKQIINLEINIKNFSKCAADYTISKESYLNSIKDIFTKNGTPIYVWDGNTRIQTESDRGQEKFICTYFCQSLNLESRYVNLELDISPAPVLPDLYKHYNHDICFVSLHTEEIKVQGLLSAESISKYCNMHHISYKIFDRSMLDGASGNWSKTFVIQNLLIVYDVVVWLDSDIIITNYNYNIRSLISSFNQSLIFCRDPSSYHPINSGVMIFKKTNFTDNYLKHINSLILSFSDKSSVYKNGGDQPHIWNVAEMIGEKDRDYLVLPENTFNSHPVNWRDGDFLVHLMGYGGLYRNRYMRYLLDKYSDQE